MIIMCDLLLLYYFSMMIKELSHITLTLAGLITHMTHYIKVNHFIISRSVCQ